MFCTNCGYEISSTSKFCTQCGSIIQKNHVHSEAMDTSTGPTPTFTDNSSPEYQTSPNTVAVTDNATASIHELSNNLGIEKQTTIYIGKQRNAGLVILYSIITFGIYHAVWYYKINKEISLHDPEQTFSPGLATFALFIPIASWVTLYNTANRIKLMQMQDNSRDLISPGASLVWAILFGLGYYVVVQGALNNHWYAHKRSLSNKNVKEFFV